MSRIEALGIDKGLSGQLLTESCLVFTGGYGSKRRSILKKRYIIAPQQHLRGASSHKRKAIVSRLNVLEDLAAMSILCSDKNVTLTKIELSINEPKILAG
jgi:hypothetical protein